jgi:hypothetical protein
VTRTSILSIFLSFALAPLYAQNLPQNSCNLQMTMTCDSTSCTATTTNFGSVTCGGTAVAGFVAYSTTSVPTLSNFTNGLVGNGQCFDYTAPPSPNGGTSYVECYGPGSLAPGASFTQSVGVQSSGQRTLIGFTEIIDDTNPNLFGFAYSINGASGPTCVPTASVPAQTQSGVDYNVTWTPVSDPGASFIIDESTTADFSAITSTQTINGFSATFKHDVSAATTYYYRVRTTTCGGSPGANSATVAIVIQPPLSVSADTGHADVSVPLGATVPVHFSISAHATAGTPFTATSDQPFFSVSPANGTIPSNGNLNLDVTVNTSGLPAGTNSGNIDVTSSSSGASLAHLKASANVSVPFTSGGKTLPPSNALIIPVVTHVTGASAPFQSDVRITNATGASVTYQLTFTPANSDGTTNGKIATITLASGQTFAVDDILKTQFGYGAGGSNDAAASGALEIRPLNSSSPLTFASSRTYATTSSGTYGQFIPAIPFSQFATFANLIPIGGTPPSKPPVLSMQQVAQSARFHTNLGLVEGSGTAASGNIRILDDSGNLLKTVPFSLAPGEQKQLGNFLAANGISTLDDGRIEVEVDSQSGGSVMTYASVLDNQTADPLAVSPVQTTQVSGTKYVVPGIAELQGISNFHSDLRLFNGGGSTVTAHATFYPQGGGTPVSAGDITLAPGQTKAFDNILPSLFNVTAGGGSVVFTTDTPSSLVATARTYTLATGGGTYGQFIPGVSVDQATAVGARPLQILQLEESKDFRSNIGLAEVTGNPAHVKLSLVTPDSKVAAVDQIDLPPFGFLQRGSFIANVYPGHSVYNARVIVEVTSGTGKVAAYGSVIDNHSQDATYVPAQ